MKIYTKRGDKGQTDSIGHGRVNKNSSMIKAVGKVDSLSSFIGIVPVIKSDRISKERDEIQKDLYKIGTILVSIKPIELDISKLEEWIDFYCENSPSISGFILPRSQWNVARAICREAEISILDYISSMVEIEVDTESLEIVSKYLNRLSDYLFAVSRYYNIVILDRPEIYA